MSRFLIILLVTSIVAEHSFNYVAGHYGIDVLTRLLGL